ncbi:MAG: hypothetical protein ABJD24_08345 [Acidimicrobiales bacterium]
MLAPQTVPATADELSSSRRRTLTWGTLIAVALAVWGWRIGLRPLGDNSFLTHLETGRRILDHGIPRRDPYTFTAPGTPWVVQSWLASAWYGVLDRVGGWRALQLFTGAVTLALSMIIWRLTVPARSVLARAAIAALALAVATGTWSERPLLLGLLFLGLSLLAVDGRLDARWLIPIGWLWVNAHGSFPLGLLAVGVITLGRRLEGESIANGLRALKLLALGMVLGGINPLGPKLLTFPIHLLGRQAILNHILEWQAPRFIIPGQRLFLLQVAVAALLLARRRNWVLGVSMAVFVPLALLSARNINVASLVLLMAMAPSARTERGLSGEQTARAATLGTPILLCFGLLMTLVSTTKPAVDLSGYPMKAVTWIDAHTDITAERIATQDVIGNFLELVGNGHIPVFVDDRADMFPEAVFNDSIKLLDADRSWAEVLNRYHVTLVLWAATSPLAAVLEASPNWHVVYDDDDWIVAAPIDRTL